MEPTKWARVMPSPFCLALPTLISLIELLCNTAEHATERADKISSRAMKSRIKMATFATTAG
ncbi:MAG: hypothetical protein C0508_01180 [Cyanobacteria bacterium PR.023]|nr:hypothetical protein [Cyanobacteria bacterium PR.023]